MWIMSGMGDLFGFRWEWNFFSFPTCTINPLVMMLYNITKQFLGYHVTFGNFMQSIYKCNRWTTYKNACTCITTFHHLPPGQSHCLYLFRICCCTVGLNCLTVFFFDICCYRPFLLKRAITLACIYTCMEWIMRAKYRTHCLLTFSVFAWLIV